MITFAVEDNIPELKNIWKEIFHDEDWYLELFFHTYFERNASTLVYKVDGLIVSMLHMIPFLFKDSNLCEKKVLYFYALATLPEHRGLGIMEQLMKRAKEYALVNEFSLEFLIPAEEQLFEYYKNREFTKFTSKTTLSVTQKVSQLQLKRYEINEIELSDCKEVFEKIYQYQQKEEFKGILLSERDFVFFTKTLFHEGGGIFMVYEKNETSTYIFYMKEQNRIHIFFSTINQQDIIQLSAELLNDFDEVIFENVTLPELQLEEMIENSRNGYKIEVNVSKKAFSMSQELLQKDQNNCFGNEQETDDLLWPIPL